MTGFIIVYFNNDSLTVPYQWDDDCEGAVEAWDGQKPIAVFPDRKTAQKAIAVSTAWNRLLQAQGKTFNEDFTDPKFRKPIRIVPLKAEVPA